jgi:methionine sulfoxide reductase heme-binding subunit
MSAQLPWYVARASGIVAWVLLSGSVLWGLSMTTRTFRRRVRRPWLLDLHRFLGGLAVIFTGIHVAAILADTYVHFGLAEVLVPLASKWRPIPVAFGIVGLYLLAAVEVTSLVRDRIPNQLWRRVHFLSFPLYVVTTVHMLTAGTDRRHPLLILAAVVSSAAVLALTAVRVNRDLAAAQARAGGTVPPRSPRPDRVPTRAAAGPRTTRPTAPAFATPRPTSGGPTTPHRRPRPATSPAPRGHR